MPQDWRQLLDLGEADEWLQHTQETLSMPCVRHAPLRLISDPPTYTCYI